MVSMHIIELLLRQSTCERRRRSSHFQLCREFKGNLGLMRSYLERERQTERKKKRKKEGQKDTERDRQTERKLIKQKATHSLCEMGGRVKDYSRQPDNLSSEFNPGNPVKWGSVS